MDIFIYGHVMQNSISSVIDNALSYARICTTTGKHFLAHSRPKHKK